MLILHYCRKKLLTTTTKGSISVLCVLLLLAACDNAADDDSETTTQLVAPTTVSANFVDTNTLEISWSAVSGASEYKVYMDDNPEASSVEYLAAVSTGTSFTKSDLQASTKYWFWVKACSSSANADCSGYSTSAEGDTTPQVVMIAPSDFSASAGSGGITLSWSSVDGYSYHLLRSEDDCITSLEDLDYYSSNCSNPKLSLSVSSGLVDSSIEAELTYYYSLEVVDSAGNRDYVSSEPFSLLEAEFTTGEVLFGKFFADGIDFAPALDESESRLYVVSGNLLYALDIILGEEKWSAPFSTGGKITATPVLDATGNIYVSSAESLGNIIYKVGKSGELQWSSSGDNSVASTGVQDALALIESDNVNSLYFANGSGAIFSSANLSDNATTKIHTMAGGVVGAMAIGWYSDLFLADESKNIVILSPSSTDSTFNMGELLVVAPALDTSQNLYFATDQSVYSYTSSGIERWQHSINADSLSSSPVLGAGGNSVFQTDNDTLYKLDSSTGSEIWSYNFSGNIYDTTPVVDAHGNIYVGLSRGGKVVVLNNDGALVATYSTGKSAGVSTPLKLSSRAKLYLAADNWLYAMQAEAKVDEESPWPQYKGNIRNTAFIGDSFGADTENFYARAELDNDNLIFLEDENGKSWISDDSDYTVGTSSMRSPVLNHSETACITAISNKSGSLSFFWQVSSERSYDFLSLSIVRAESGETKEIAKISGSVDWEQKSGIAVSSGEEIKWCYGKDNSDHSDSADTGWLDDVQIQ